MRNFNLRNKSFDIVLLHAFTVIMRAVYASDVGVLSGSEILLLKRFKVPAIALIKQRWNASMSTSLKK